jgi:peptidoglycan/xylan/chitin deacetylase (PgdA/CDA1 family)
MQPPNVTFEERPNRLRQTAKRALETLLPRRALLVRGPENSRQVCLTFDDGPHPVHTPALLDALFEHGVRATFFVVGERAAECPELVRRMVREGHVVGSHSYHHRPPEETSTAELYREVCESIELLSPLIGKPPSLFRPPHGKLTMGKLGALWSLGQTVVLWSLDPRDYTKSAHIEVTHRVDVEGGDIVLLHDSLPLASAALGDIVGRVRARGFGLTTVDEWT